MRELLGLALFRDEPFQDFEVQHEFPYIGHRTMRLNARRISTGSAEPRIVLLAIEDVTKRREEAEARYQRLFQSAKDGILVFDEETGKLADVNPFFLELTGFGREQLIGRPIGEMECFACVDVGGDFVAQTRLHEVIRRDTCIVTSNGREIEVEIVANRYAVGGQDVVQVNVRDVRKRNEAVRALQQSEERFRLFVDSVRDYALFQTDPEGIVISWNSGAERLLGYSESEILGQSGVRVFTPEDIANGVPAQEMQTARANGWAEDERWHMRKDGSRFFASGVMRTVYDEEGHLRGLAKVMRDVTERKRAAEQQRRQAQLLELAQDIIIVCDAKGIVTFWNGAAADKFGWSREEAIGRNAYTLLETVFPEPLDKIQSKLIEEGRWEGELVHARRDHSRITVWSRWAVQQSSDGTPNCVLQINTDITERKKADQNIRRSLREKEVLLKEVHHRVKNNPQIITSLLNLQANYLGDVLTRTILEDMNTRVRSIAAIHEMLYGSADLSRVDFARYPQKLARDLMSVYSVRASAVRVNVDSGPVLLDITQAVPCGLMVNELLTNSFKHAFPDNRAGEVEVRFNCVDATCVLEVADDGVGLPSDLDMNEAQSLGLQLLTLLAQQLKGTLEVVRSPGTRFIVKFPQIT